MRAGPLTFVLLVSTSCVVGPDPSCADGESGSVRFLPGESQLLVVGERRSLWIHDGTHRRERIEVTVLSGGGAIRELGRKRPFGSGMIRLDLEGVEPGTATVRARLRCGEVETRLTVLRSGEPLCETEGPPPYCIAGRYRILATELSDRCTGEVDSFETVAEVTRSPTSATGGTLRFGDHFTVDGLIGPDGAFVTETPTPIGLFRDGRQVTLEPFAVALAGFRARGHFDVIGLFPSPDPIDFAPCERIWELEGERL